VDLEERKLGSPMDTKEREYNYGFIYGDETFRIIGTAMNVANELGCGFLEAVYQEALEIELTENAIPFESQKRISISYKGKVLNKEYIADFVCFNNIIVEIKTIKRITEIEEAQIINYLRATKLPLGLIINFGSMKLEWKRYINT
jgi:GxxExxY protein